MNSSASPRTATNPQRQAAAASPRASAVIDPTILSVLRVFIALHVFALAVSAVAFLGHDSPQHPVASVWAMLVATSGLLAFSFAPNIRRSRLYLPAAIAILLIVPALGQLLALRRNELAYEKMALEQVLFLVVPIVIVAWQYSLRSSAVLALLGGGMDLALAIVADVHPERREVFLHVLATRTIGLVIVGYVVSRLVGKLRAQHQTLAHANAQLANYADSVERLTSSRERNRVARELHDTLAHTLSAMTVQLEAVRAVWSDSPDRAREMVDRTTTMAREGVGEARRALQALRSSPLEDLGLVLAIRQLAETLGEQTGARIHLDLPLEPITLFAPLEQGVYRIAQEALENIERHAGAQNVRVRLARDATGLELSIEDDGCGFNPEDVPQDRFGLAGIRERAELLGAAIRVDAAVGTGARIHLRLTTEPGGNP